MQTRRAWTASERSLMSNLYVELGEGHAAASEFTRQTGIPLSRESLYGVVKRAKTQIEQPFKATASAGPVSEWKKWDEAPQPESQQGYEPRVLSPAPGVEGVIERRVSVPDCHVPAHDRVAFEVCRSVIRDFNPHKVVIMGDFLDLLSLNGHGKSAPDQSKLAHELQEGNYALDSLQESAPSAEWTALAGNHEARAERFENSMAEGALAGMLDIPASLYITPRRGGYHRESGATLRGMKWIPLREQTWVDGPLGYCHGVFEGSNHCRDHATHEAPRAGVKHMVTGHLHQITYCKAKNECDAWCCGFLGDATRTEFAYTKGRPLGWGLGFLIHEIHGDHVQTIPVHIRDGRAVFGGRVYGGEVA